MSDQSPKTVLSASVIAALLSLSPLLRGADQRKFEVASVKRTDKCDAGNSVDPGSVALRGVRLKQVVMEAFAVKIDQIVGPSWLETDCFDISAKSPEGATRDQLPAMLQSLLAERFKLGAHKEDRPRTGYALVVDKAGPKCKEDDPNSNFMGSRAGHTYFGFGRNGALKGVMTMAGVANYLSRRGYGPVEDHTGLTGKYDIDLTFTPNPDFEPMGLIPAVQPVPPGIDAPAPPERVGGLFSALREQLGLKLERRQIQVPFLVIDRIERIPTEN